MKVYPTKTDALVVIGKPLKAEDAHTLTGGRAEICRGEKAVELSHWDGIAMLALMLGIDMTSLIEAILQLANAVDQVVVGAQTQAKLNAIAREAQRDR